MGKTSSSPLTPVRQLLASGAARTPRAHEAVLPAWPFYYPLSTFGGSNSSPNMTRSLPLAVALACLLAAAAAPAAARSLRQAATSSAYASASAAGGSSASAQAQAGEQEAKGGRSAFKQARHQPLASTGLCCPLDQLPGPCPCSCGNYRAPVARGLATAEIPGAGGGRRPRRLYATRIARRTCAGRR